MTRLLRLLALLLFALPAAAQQFEGAKNMTLFGHLNPVDTVGTHAAIWGYAAPDGREYGFVGSQIGTHIIDVTEKPIRQVAFIPGPWSRWREMKTYRQLLYIVSESADPGKGLQIVDLSGLPARAELVHTDTASFTTAHTLFIRDHYLYVMGTARDAGANGGVMILDLEPDPLRPRLVGRIDRDYYHDAWVRNDTLVGAAIYGNGIDVFDIRDKANPVHLANINYPYSGTHNVEITADGGYLVSSDEIGFTPKTMKVWDIRDLQNVRMVAEQTHNLLDIVHNVHVWGRYVLAAWYTGGVRILDMIDPTHPREVAFYDSYPGRSGGYDGVWESFLLPSGRVLSGDRNTGLYVLEWERTVGASVSGVIRDAATLEPIGGVKIGVAELDTTIATPASGAYYIGGARGDEITITLERFGYESRTFTTSLDGDDIADFEMRPLAFLQGRIEAIASGGEPIEEFAYAVEPYITSRHVDGSSAPLSLPADTAFTVTVGSWGYRIAELGVRLTQPETAIVATLERRYQDDATLDLGWALGVPGDDATTGQWIRIAPYLGYPQSGWIHPATQPDGRVGRVFMTGAPPRNANPQENDVNGGTTTLVSPLMDLRDHPEPLLSFDLWMVHYPNFRSDTTLAIDSFTVDITNDDGATWYRAYSEARGRGLWLTRRVPIRPIVPLTDRMRVRFRARDVDEPTTMFVALDNIDIAPTPAQASVDRGGSARRGDARVSRLGVTPHPATDGAHAHVAIAAPGPIRVEIVDPLGERVGVLFDGVASGDMRLRLPALPAGSYVLRAGASAMPFVVIR